MSRADITQVAATAQWQERIEKERVHAQTRRDFAVNPKTMYVVTEKPQQSGWSREFQAQRAAQQAALAAEEEAKGAGAAQHYTAQPAHSYSLMTASPKHATHAHTKTKGAAPVRTVVALTSPLTHTTTIVGAGAGAAPVTPPPQTPPPAAAPAAAAASAGATTRSPLAGAGATISAAGATVKPKAATGAAAHMRVSPVRRAHPLATADPSLATTLRRQDLVPTEKWEWPQTSNHEYGWNTAPVMPPDRASALWYKGLKSSDVSEFVSQYVATQGGKTPFSTQNAANRG